MGVKISGMLKTPEPQKGGNRDVPQTTLFRLFQYKFGSGIYLVTCSAGADISKMMFSNHFMIIQVALIHIKAASLSVFEEPFFSFPHILMCCPERDHTEKVT